MPRFNAAPILDAGDSLNRRLFGRWPMQMGGFDYVKDIGPRNMHLKRGGSVGAIGASMSPAGRALSMSSSTDYLQTVASFPPSSAITNMMWLKMPNTSGAFYGFGNSGATNRMSWENQAGSINFDNADDANGRLKVNWSSYFDKWVRVAHVYDHGASFKGVYVNGVLIASGSSLSSPPPAPGSPLTLGYWAAYGVRPPIEVTDWIIWSRALTPQEIKRLYVNPWAGTVQSRSVRGALLPTNYTIAAEGIAREYAVGDATFARGYALAAEGIQRQYSFEDADFVFTPASTGDTHDGFKRRTRREKALDAAQERAREEWIANRNAVRLSLEAAMGMAVEATDEPPAEVLEAVQQAEAIIPTLRAPEPDRAALERAAALVERLQAAVVEMERAERQRALDEDDEEVMMLLRAL